jgi:hypothetical protein
MGHAIDVGEETLLADIWRRLVDEFACVAPQAVNSLGQHQPTRGVRGGHWVVGLQMDVRCAPFWQCPAGCDKAGGGNPRHLVRP